MSRYISIFVLSLLISVFLFYFCLMLFDGNTTEGAILTVCFIFIVFLSFLIAQMFYLIDLVKKKL